jgi:hypothetical protein
MYGFLRWLNEHFNLLRKVYNLGVMDCNDFKPTIIAYNKSKPDDLLFIFNQVRDRVKETADEGDRIYNKSITIFSIAIAGIIPIGGYVFTQHSISALVIAGLLTISLLWMVASILRNNIFPSFYKSIGSYAKDLYIDEYYTDKDEKAYKLLLHSEIMNFEKRVVINEKKNEERNDRLNKCYKILYWIPAVYIACLIIGYFVSLWA